MARETRIEQVNGYWDLYYGGERIIQGESFGVVDKVRYHLDNPGRWDGSEAYEIADWAARWRELIEPRHA